MTPTVRPNPNPRTNTARAPSLPGGLPDPSSAAATTEPRAGRPPAQRLGQHRVNATPRAPLSITPTSASWSPPPTATGLQTGPPPTHRPPDRLQHARSRRRHAPELLFAPGAQCSGGAASRVIRSTRTSQRSDRGSVRRHLAHDLAGGVHDGLAEQDAGAHLIRARRQRVEVVTGVAGAPDPRVGTQCRVQGSAWTMPAVVASRSEYRPAVRCRSERW